MDLHRPYAIVAAIAVAGIVAFLANLKSLLGPESPGSPVSSHAPAGPTANRGPVEVEAPGPSGPASRARPAVEEVLVFPRDPEVGAAVEFQARTRHEPESHDWDFGDGTAGAGRSVRHVFDRAGRFVVRVRVTNLAGADVASTEVVVRAVAPPGAAAREAPELLVNQVVAKPAEGRAPLEVSFSALTSGGAIRTFRWEFGDGVTSAEPTPSHIYAQPGEYAVLVRATALEGQVAEGRTSVRVAGPKTYRLATRGPADFLTLKDALNAIRDGDTLKVEPGEYRVSSSIDRRDLRNVRILGPGKPDALPDLDGCSVRFVSESDWVLRLWNCQDVTVEGICFEGETRPGGYGLLNFFSCHDVTVRGCGFVNGGLNLGGAEGRGVGFHVSNVAVRVPLLPDGMRGGSAFHVWKCDDVRLQNVTVTGSSHSLYLEDCRDCVVESFRVRDVDFGLWIGDSCKRIRVKDSDFRGAHTYQIRLSKAAGSDVLLESTSGKIVRE